MKAWVAIVLSLAGCRSAKKEFIAYSNEVGPTIEALHYDYQQIDEAKKLTTAGPSGELGPTLASSLQIGRACKDAQDAARAFHPKTQSYKTQELRDNGTNLALAINKLTLLESKANLDREYIHGCIEAFDEICKTSTNLSDVARSAGVEIQEVCH